LKKKKKKEKREIYYGCEQETFGGGGGGDCDADYNSAEKITSCATYSCGGGASFRQRI
jgi:hypothetical protein